MLVKKNQSNGDTLGETANINTIEIPRIITENIIYRGRLFPNLELNVPKKGS